MLKSLQDLRYSVATENLVRFWSGLPRSDGHVCPKRGDFSSALINSVLPEIFLSEWRTEYDLIVIQTGTVLDRHIGEDLTGKNIFEMTPGPLRASERSYYNNLRDFPCAGMMTRSAPNRLGQHFYYRTLQLPLLDPFGRVHYFVGTGVVLKESQLVRELKLAPGTSNFGNTELIERHYFDIGAGLPSPTDHETDVAQHIFFHTL
jgi:hypothetical protein